MPDHSDLGFEESPHADLGFVAAGEQPPPAPEQPGLIRRALTWMHEPLGGPGPLEQRRKEIANSGTPGINEKTGDLETGLWSFVRGMTSPEDQPLPDVTERRFAQFRHDHPVLGTVLPIAGGLTQPAIPSPAKALPAAAPAASLLRTAAEKTIEPTAEAVLLRSRGVPLTVGQLNPRSAVGQIEEASTSLRGVGAGIKAQRDTAQKAWQQLVMKEGHPPGMPEVPPDWKLSDALSAMYEGFKPSYEGVANELIYPAVHGAGGGPLQSLGKQAGVMERAALDPSILAPDATRQAVHNFLQHQLTILPQREGAVGKIGVGDLLQVRSNVRDAAREAVQRQDFATAQLLGNGEDAITKAIESQASPGVVDALRQADSKYRAYKVVEDAAARAGDSPSGFSPSQLSASLKSSMGRGQFARGGGGDLRELSRAGKHVFESVSPPTGARLLTVGPLGEWVTGPATFLANRAPRESAQWLDPAEKMGAAVALRAGVSGDHAAQPPDLTQRIAPGADVPQWLRDLFARIGQKSSPTLADASQQ